MNSFRCLQRLTKPSLRTFSTTSPIQLPPPVQIPGLAGLLEKLDSESKTTISTHNALNKPTPYSAANTNTNAATLEKSRVDLEDRLLVDDAKRQMWRRWKAGDIYAPHDLGSVEASKWKIIQRRPEKDIFDMLGTNPMRHYKNLKLMTEFVTETGRIRHSRETGLRPRNQRRMARAVRRAIGIGLMPSVYHHPEIQAAKLHITNYRG